MSQVRTRKRGKTYSYIFEAGKKPNGKRKVVEKGGFSTKKDAYNAGVAAYTDWKHGNIGNIQLQEVTPAILDNWMRSLQSVGYSKGILSDIHSLLHHALNYAVYPAELISSNPANYIKVPKKAPTNIVKRHIITPEKLSELLEENPFGSPYYIPILLLYHTGMRIGKCAA